MKLHCHRETLYPCVSVLRAFVASRVSICFFNFYGAKKYLDTGNDTPYRNGTPYVRRTGLRCLSKSSVIKT